MTRGSPRDRDHDPADRHGRGRHGFWEAYLRAEPESRDGQRRHALRRPPARSQPGGTREVRADASSVRPTPRTRSPTTDLVLEDRITRDVLASSARLQRDEAGPANGHDPRVVDQMGGPQTMLPQRASSSPRTRPSAWSCSSPASRPTRGTWRTTSSSCHEACDSGLTAPGSSPSGRSPSSSGCWRRRSRTPSSRRSSRSRGTRTARRSATSSATSSTPPTRAFLEALRATTSPRPPENGLVVGARRRRAVPHPDPALDDARSSTRDGPPDGPGPARVDRRRAPGDRKRRRLRRRHRRLSRLARRARRRTRPASRASLIARANEDIERAVELAPAMFRRAAGRRLQRQARRGVQGERRAVRVLLPALARHTRPGTYYVNTYDLPSRTFSQLAATTYHEAIPGHHFQIALEMENPASTSSGASAPVRRRRLCRGLGPVRRAAGRRARAVPQRCRALRDARCAGVARLAADRRPGHARARLVAPAVDRLAARHRAVRDRRRHRDRPLHRWPGQALTYKVGHARDPSGCARSSSARDGAGSTSAGSTTSSSGTARCRSVTLAPAELGLARPCGPQPLADA